MYKSKHHLDPPPSTNVLCKTKFLGSKSVGGRPKGSFEEIWSNRKAKVSLRCLTPDVWHLDADPLRAALLYHSLFGYKESYRCSKSPNAGEILKPAQPLGSSLRVWKVRMLIFRQCCHLVEGQLHNDTKQVFKPVSFILDNLWMDQINNEPIRTSKVWTSQDWKNYELSCSLSPFFTHPCLRSNISVFLLFWNITTENAYLSSNYW